MRVCLEKQRKAFTAHVLQYRSPDLAELQSKVKALVAEQGLTVTIAVFWGRGRYVELLWSVLLPCPSSHPIAIITSLSPSPPLPFSPFPSPLPPVSQAIHRA